MITVNPVSIFDFLLTILPFLLTFFHFILTPLWIFYLDWDQPNLFVIPENSATTLSTTDFHFSIL